MRGLKDGRRRGGDDEGGMKRGDEEGGKKEDTSVNTCNVETY